MSDFEVGPIDYLALAFPGAKFSGNGLDALIDLIDRDIIRVLDLRVVKREMDGTVTGITLADLGAGTLDVAVFEGVESGLLADDDLGEFGAMVEPGDAVGVVVYENTWAGPFVSAMRTAGAEVIASARIPAPEVIARLEELESELAGAGA